MKGEDRKTFSSKLSKDEKVARILVADDDDVIRGLVRTLLERAGYSVIEAVDGAEAVKKFSEFREGIDMLVLDVRMPGKDGRQAYDEIRHIRPDIKVLFISGYEKDVLAKYGVNDEAYHVMPKPFMPADLIAGIRECLETAGQ